MPINTEIIQRRQRAGLTQQQAADIVHVSRRTWQNWEQGAVAMPGAAWELFFIKTDGVGK